MEIIDKEKLALEYFEEEHKKYGDGTGWVKCSTLKEHYVKEFTPIYVAGFNDAESIYLEKLGNCVNKRATLTLQLQEAKELLKEIIDKAYTPLSSWQLYKDKVVKFLKQE